MSARANPTSIGIFVSGAIALAILALIAFGSGKFFSHQDKFIIYFSDSVNGLAIGSPVKFKGVQIGQVESIRIRYNQPDDNDAIPVIVSIDTTRLKNELGEGVNLSDTEEFKRQINGGLRAKLDMQSFLTGVLYIELDDYDPPPPFQPIETGTDYMEIPSIRSGLSEMMKSVTLALNNISQIDFKSIADKFDHLAKELDDGVGQIDFKAINDSILAATNSLNAILADPKLKDAIAHLDTTLGSIQTLADNVNDQVKPISNEIQLTAQRARGTLDQLDATLRTIRDMLEPGSPLRFEVDNTLNELSAAMKSVRVLTDFLERNPGALISGKAGPQPMNFALPPDTTIAPAPTPIRIPTPKPATPADATTPADVTPPAATATPAPVTAPAN